MFLKVQLDIQNICLFLNFFFACRYGNSWEAVSQEDGSLVRTLGLSVQEKPGQSRS